MTEPKPVTNNFELKTLYTLTNVSIVVDSDSKFFAANDHKKENVPDYFHRGTVLGKLSGKTMILNTFYYDINESDLGQNINAVVKLVVKNVGERKFLHLDIMKTPGTSVLELLTLPSDSNRTGMSNIFSISQYEKKSIFFKKIETTPTAPIIEPVVIPAVIDTMVIEIEEKELMNQSLNQTVVVDCNLETTSSDLKVAAKVTKETIAKISKKPLFIEGDKKIVSDPKSGCVINVPHSSDKNLVKAIIKVGDTEEFFYLYQNGNAVPFLFPVGISTGENVMKTQMINIVAGKTEKKFVLFIPYNVPSNARRLYRVNTHGTEIFEKII